MTLDISELLRKRVDVLPFKVAYDIGIIEREDFKLILKSPLEVSGNATYDNHMVNLKGNITGIIEAQCSRCLEPFDFPLNIEFDEFFSKLESDEEVYPFEEEIIDLKDMIVDNLILSVPLRFICSEECKGLCPECGINLNRHQCNCNKNNIDPRLAVLKDLFKGD